MKPVEALLAAYEAGQRIFGENYVQELVDKAANPCLSGLEGLEYHFIGKLQSNKVGLLVKNVRQLSMIETIDTTKLAKKVDTSVEAAISEGSRPPGPLRVMIQVNSSGEPQKGGVESHDDAVALAKFIVSECKHLELTGLMTIGRADYTAGPENFTYLAECRAVVTNALAQLGSGEDAAAAASGEEPPAPALELSMGMSGDYPAAIEHGSTNVRVGSTIFGARAPRPPA